jgi:hypothetical protein
MPKWQNNKDVGRDISILQYLRLHSPYNPFSSSRKEEAM